MKKLIPFILFLFTSFHSHGQTWSRSYGFEVFWTGGIYTFDSVQGGIMASLIDSNNSIGGPTVDLVRINRYGDTTYVQHNIFDTLQINALTGITKLSNNNYVLTATLYDSSYLDQYQTVTFINSNGHVTSTKTICSPIYGYNTYSPFYGNANIRALAADNGGYYLIYNNDSVIQTYALDTANNVYLQSDSFFNRSYLTKYDANDNELWSNSMKFKCLSYNYTVPSTSVINPNSTYNESNMILLADGGVLVGKIYDTVTTDVGGGLYFPTGSTNSALEKINPDGTIAYDINFDQMPYPFPGSFLSSCAIFPTHDTGFVLLLSSNPEFIIKFNSSGVLTDTFIVPGSASYNSEIVQGCQLSNGNYLFSAYMIANYNPFLSLPPYTYGFVFLDSHLHFLSFTPNDIANHIEMSASSFLSSFIPNDMGGAFMSSAYGGVTYPPQGYLYAANFDSLLNAYPAFVSGNVVLDNNANCQKDSGDFNIANSIIKLTDTSQQEYFAISDDNGNYNVNVPFGKYVANHSIYGPEVNRCPAGNFYYYNINSAGNMADQNFYDIRTHGISDISIAQYAWQPFVPGFDNHIKLQISNAGTLTANTTLSYVLDPAVQYLSATPTPSFISGDTLFFDINNLYADSTTYIDINLNNNANLGSTLNLAAFAPLANDPTLFNNMDTLSSIVISSFDPNEKFVNRALYTLGNKEIIYTIDFQNTGTFPANSILVQDSIDSHLNLSSFRLISASPARPSISWKEGNQVAFNFRNINLPDSLHNEPASHGQIVYAIRPKSTVQVGDTIHNDAYIYFDFNSAVVTNTTTNIISSNPVSVTNIQKQQQNINLFPNPSDGTFTIQLPVNTAGKWLIGVTDITGHAVYYSAHSWGNCSLTLNDVTPGIYFIHVTDPDTNNVTVQKLVITK